MVLLAGVGLLGGLLAGWLGLGGGIILGPLLLYLPPAAGLSPLDMKEVARLTIVQSLFSSAAAGIAHRRANNVHGPVVLWMGPTIATASLAGAIVSEWEILSSRALLGLFASLALLAAVLMCVRSPRGCAHLPYDPAESQHLPAGCAPPAPPLARGRAVSVAAVVGVLGGMVGQSGAFLTIPLLVHVLRLPVRLAIGSSLGITFCAALAGSLGKIAGGAPMVWTHVAALVAGSLTGSQLGTALNRRGPTLFLRVALAVLIGASAVKMWWEVLR
ncbi:MAG: sulfite exporter TauE/SafE family protein [Planctomycetota bacterium]